MKRKPHDSADHGVRPSTWWNLRTRDTDEVDRFLEDLAACVADLAA